MAHTVGYVPDDQRKVRQKTSDLLDTLNEVAKLALQIAQIAAAEFVQQAQVRKRVSDELDKGRRR